MTMAAMTTANNVFIVFILRFVSCAAKRFKYSTAGQARRCGRFARFCNTFSSISSNHQRVDTPGSVVTFHALMRFPLALTTKIAAYIIGHKLRGTKKFATVLQLEPLHTCNLTCTGCGRIREYSTSLKDMMSLEDCLGAAEECNAPMISICGGEPLIYPHIEALVNGLLDQGRIVYVCTNAIFMRKKMRQWLTTELRSAGPRRTGASGSRSQLELKIDDLVRDGLVSEKDAAAIRNPKSAIRDHVIAPS